MITYKKLVRDKIPDIIKADGGECEFRVIDSNKEYKQYLDRKLREEVNEFISSPSIGEIADILEVLDALKAFHNFSVEDIKEAKRLKRKTHGGFIGRIVLETASEEKPVIERDESHVTLNMGNTELES